MVFLSLKEKTRANRDFSTPIGVSTTMRSASIAISVEQAEQCQRENAVHLAGRPKTSISVYSFKALWVLPLE